VLGLWSSFRVTRNRRPFPISSRKFASHCKKSDGGYGGSACRSAMHQPNERSGGGSWGLFRCERSDDFFESRMTAKRVPMRMEFEQAVAERVRNPLNPFDLFNGEVFLTNPGINLRKIDSELYAIHGVLGDRYQFACSSTLA